jgi:hypothetical protein
MKVETIVVRCTTEEKKIYTNLAKSKKIPLSKLIRNIMNLTAEPVSSKIRKELESKILELQNKLKNL